MTETEVLKKGRNFMLALHKSLLDRERSLYEGVNGPATSAQFLNLLLEDSEFAWLRKFSTLIVDIDEMFAQKDGFEEEAIRVHLAKMGEIVSMSDDDETFIAKYKSGLQENPEAASIQAELRSLLA